MEQSVCLDDDDDIISDIVNTAHLNIDQDSVSAAMIHSPTTDTLDSVMLEPSDGSETQDGDLDKSDSPSPIPDETVFPELDEKEIEGAEAENKEKEPTTTEMESEIMKAEEEKTEMPATTEITDTVLSPLHAEVESEITSVEETPLSASPQLPPATEAVLEKEPGETTSELAEPIMEPTKETLTEDNIVTNNTTITITTPTSAEPLSLVTDSHEEGSPEAVVIFSSFFELYVLILLIQLFTAFICVQSM